MSAWPVVVVSRRSGDVGVAAPSRLDGMPNAQGGLRRRGGAVRAGKESYHPDRVGDIFAQGCRSRIAGDPPALAELPDLSAEWSAPGTPPRGSVRSPANRS